jgi:hypothetical protein
MVDAGVHFWPHEGALLDLGSLVAIPAGPARLLDAFLRVTLPGGNGVILDGLELVGDLQPSGPPGTRRPEAHSPGATVTPGTVLLTDASGGRFVVTVDAPLESRWPDSTGSGVRGALVLKLDLLPGATAGGLSAAHRVVRPRMGFAALDRLGDPDLLPIAVAVGNGRDWATDYARYWQPEHDAVRSLVRRIDQIEQTIWRAEPEGSVWDRGVLGRNWVRYQTVAAAAVQATRISLETRATSTLDRVRLLGALRRQLAGSVERAATELLQVIGPVESAGPYREAVAPQGRTA